MRINLNKKFTLIELLVIIAISIILIGMIIGFVNGGKGLNNGVTDTKVVSSKTSALESRFNTTAYMLSDHGSGVKPTTVYYLVAQDNTVCEVGVGVFSNTKDGESVTGNWENK